MPDSLSSGSEHRWEAGGVAGGYCQSQRVSGSAPSVRCAYSLALCAPFPSFPSSVCVCPASRAGGSINLREQNVLLGAEICLFQSANVSDTPRLVMGFSQEGLFWHVSGTDIAVTPKWYRVNLWESLSEMGTKWGKNRKTGNEMTNCLPPQVLTISRLNKSQQKTTASPCFAVSIPKGCGWGGVGGGRRWCAPPGPFPALRASFLPPQGVQPQALVASTWANYDHLLF